MGWEGSAQTSAAKYYYALGKLIAFRRDGTLYYVHTDHLGSSRVTTDGNGALVSQVSYYHPYGACGKALARG